MRHQLRIIDLFLAILMALGAASSAHAQCIVQELHSDGKSLGSGFGPTAAAGDVLAVGHYLFDAPGRVHVYRNIAGQWTPEAILIDPDMDHETAFFRPATNGDVIFVAASAALDSTGLVVGAVHVYRFDGSRWVYESRLEPPRSSLTFAFGFSLAVDDDVAVIGARDSQVGGFFQAGSAFVYRRDPHTQTWRAEQVLYAFSPAVNEFFGMSVDIRGDYIIVGAKGVNQSRGAAYLFRYDGQRWVGEAELTAFDALPHDQLGWDVALAPDYAAAGAIDGDQPLGTGMGAAYVFSGSNWSTQTKLIPANPSLPSQDFGAPLRATSDGSVLLIGGSGDSFGATFAGAAYLFRRINHVWTQTAKFGAPVPTPFGGFSGFTAINGDQAFITAFSAPPTGDGAVFVVNGIHQRDCNSNGVVDACEGVAGPTWDVTPASCSELADLDGDGIVGPADLGLLLSAWGPCPCTADLDADGGVDGFDVAYLLGAWGPVQSK